MRFVVPLDCFSLRVWREGRGEGGEGKEYLGSE